MSETLRGFNLHSLTFHISPDMGLGGGGGGGGVLGMH